jgi:hypothetical protein
MRVNTEDNAFQPGKPGRQHKRRMPPSPPIHYYMRGRGTLARLNSDILNEISGWLVKPGDLWGVNDECNHCGYPDPDSTHHACYIWHEYTNTFPLLSNSIAAFFPNSAHAILFIEQRCESIGRHLALYLDQPYIRMERNIKGTAASIRLRNYPTAKAVAEYEPYARENIIGSEIAARDEYVNDFTGQLGDLGFCLKCRGFEESCTCGYLF